MAYFTNFQMYLCFCSDIPFEEKQISDGILNFSVMITFIEPIKVIKIKVFVKRGAGKRNFIHKGFFPAKYFFNTLIILFFLIIFCN